MWFTITAALGAFLLWAVTSIVLYFTPPVPVSLLQRMHIPTGFIALIMFLPHALLAGVYFMYRPRESVAFKHWSGWAYFRNTFFPIKMINNKPYEREYIILYAVVPHGIFPVSVMFGIILNPAFGHVTVAVTSLLFWIPIARELTCLAGCAPANTADIIGLLDRGRSVLVTPEGMRAALHYNEPDGVMRVLRGIPGESAPRKGFIRCATGSTNHARIRIVPVYCEGELELYTVWNVFPWLQRTLLLTYRYPWPVLAFGWWGTPWPKPRPLTLHFGEPISLMCGDAMRDVDDVHKEYCSAVDALLNAARQRA